jgi:hypothetical protein
MNEAIAVFASDIHLTLQQPSCRADKNWMEIQQHYLEQLKEIAQGGASILVAGDIFDRWNPSPELINFALKHLPDGMICVPGQHDLPNHRLDQMHRSAYGVLLQAGKIIDATDHRVIRGGNLLTIYGFGWGQEIRPNEDPEEEHFDIALIHRYCWANDACYPGAPEGSHVSAFQESLDGYNIAVFGDNHKGFLNRIKTKSGRCHVLNCGGFIRRKSDEVGYQPSVGVLYSDGHVEQKKLNTAIDRFHEKIPERKELPVNMKDFIDQLESLGEHGLNFKEAVLQHLESEEIDKETRQIILRSHEERKPNDQ